MVVQREGRDGCRRQGRREPAGLLVPCEFDASCQRRAAAALRCTVAAATRAGWTALPAAGLPVAQEPAATPHALVPHGCPPSTLLQAPKLTAGYCVAARLPRCHHAASYSVQQPVPLPASQHTHETGACAHPVLAPHPCQPPLPSHLNFTAPRRGLVTERLRRKRSYLAFCRTMPPLMLISSQRTHTCELFGGRATGETSGGG